MKIAIYQINLARDYEGVMREQERLVLISSRCRRLSTERSRGTIPLMIR